MTTREVLGLPEPESDAPICREQPSCDCRGQIHDVPEEE